MIVPPPRRRWLFRLAAVVLVPALLLGATEAGLRFAGYGYPTGFFREIRVGGEDFLVENDKFGLRFFPPELSRSPAPVVMRANKPAGTHRIFLLGESAALGDPRPAYGAGRYLQALLRERFPEAKFEVVCVAMTAINSHAILPIARECARHEGDLWILCMGNNEMVGPFGAATIFGPQAPPIAYVRLNLAIQKTRLGQWLVALGRQIKGQPSNAASWAGMEMFVKSRVAPDDARKEVVYQSFRRNLDDILRTGLGSGAQVILSTVAVNLRDCPPFASVSGTNLTAADRAARDQLSAEASVAEKQGDFTQAGTHYERAVTLDPKSAELQFRLGDCLLRLTNNTSARQRFEAARDYDALPFRADSRINGMIAQASEQFAGSNLVFCDTVAAIASHSAVRIPGQESFYEHVHFNFDGNYRLARAWAEQAERLLPATVTNRAASGWASQETCERRLGLTDWNRSAVIAQMIQRIQQPPFTSQFNNAQRLASLQAWQREIRRRMDTNAAAAAREVYLEALKQAPDDHRLHENFAEFLEAVGDLPRATAEWQQVRTLTPHHHLGHFQVGRLLAPQGKLAEAEAALREAVTLRPDLSEGWLELGYLHAAEGKLELALQEFDRSKRLIPQNPRVYYQTGKALVKFDRRADAIQNFRQAVRLNPDYWEARDALGVELAFDGKVPEAKSEFEQVIRIQPTYAMAHLNLGVALFKLGRFAEAQRQFAETVRLDPQNRLAADYVQQLQKAWPRSP